MAEVKKEEEGDGGGSCRLHRELEDIWGPAGMWTLGAKEKC